MVQARDDFEVKLAELRAAGDEAEQRHRFANSEATMARGRYANLVLPRKLAGSRVVPPSFWEDVLSFGEAGKRYRRVLETAQEKRDAEAAVRKKFAEFSRAQSGLDSALVLHELDVRREMKTAEARKRFGTDPRIAELSEPVLTIQRERDLYEARLKQGLVSDAEARDRGLAMEGHRLLDGSVRGLHGLTGRRVSYGRTLYLTFRDRESFIWLIDYRPELLPLMTIEFDLAYTNQRYLVTRSAFSGARVAAADTNRRFHGVDPRRGLGVDPKLVEALLAFAAHEAGA